jgi:hypothetical protein
MKKIKHNQHCVLMLGISKLSCTANDDGKLELTYRSLVKDDDSFVISVRACPLCGYKPEEEPK